MKSIAESDDRDKIQCKEPIEPKEINADELDNITFVGEEYEPAYRYYKNNNREFIVEIEICSKLKGNVDIKKYPIKETNETLLIISGEKLLKGENEEEEYIPIQELINNRENSRKFKLKIKINNEELGIHAMNKKPREEINYGILSLIFKIS